MYDKSFIMALMLRFIQYYKILYYGQSLVQNVHFTSPYMLRLARNRSI